MKMCSAEIKPNIISSLIFTQIVQQLVSALYVFINFEETRRILTPNGRTVGCDNFFSRFIRSHLHYISYYLIVTPFTS